MKKYRNKKLLAGLTAVSSSMLALLVCLTGTAWRNSGSINSFLKVQTSRVETIESEDGEKNPADYFKSAYGDTSKGNGNIATTLLTMAQANKLQEDEKAFCIQEQIDGSVLLMNNANALPLTSAKNITLLGHAVVQPVYKSASGGGFVDRTKVIDLYSALKDEGFAINDTVYNAYANSSSNRDHGYNVQKYALGEEPASFYTDALKNSFSQYGDAAVIMLAREGGEYRDLAMSESASDNGEEGISHLALHRNERDLLALAQSYKQLGVFKKVIVLLNTSNPMELEELETYGVDACLWIGGPGTYGFAGVAKILSGKANPSGKLVDTYAASSLSAPATVNFVTSDYTNASEVASSCADAKDFVTHYTVQTEGIYVGYKYYETRYADLIMGQGNADSSKGVWMGESKWNYADEMTYPFGYGLSYTQFEQTLSSLKWNSDKTVTASVTVTNTGKVAGKSTAELYVSVPYQVGGIEKSAIQLVGFAKTSLLQPGKSETVTITADSYLFASYDSSANDGQGGYVMEAGDYYFAIGAGVHDALNNILAKRGYSGLYDEKGNAVEGNPENVAIEQRTQTDSASYSVTENGTKVKNRFEDMDINNLVTEKVTYLSRSDWDKTYPLSAPSVTATPEMIKAIDGYTYVTPEDAPKTSSFTQSKASGLTLVAMKDVAYDDTETWTKFIDQMSLADMGKFIYEYAGVERTIDSISAPSFISNDGPDGIGQGYLNAKVNRNNGDYLADENSCTCYPNEIVAASTWDTADWEKRGEFIGEDGLFSGTVTLWCPGANLHRTPFSGRNFEYFSEDSVLSYYGSASVVKGIQSKGIIACIKHFVGNDQETQRTGLATFSTEQAFRENDLRAFEGAFTVGGALGTMTSFNRIGCTAVPHSAELLKGVLREEWGFKGYNITDACGSRSYIHSIESIAAGTDMFCMAYENRATEIISAIGRGDGYLQQSLREANQHILYALSHSALMNGMDSNTKVIAITPWWQFVLIGVDVAVGVIAIGCAVLFVSAVIKEKKEEN